ncbi:uncharacterized protein V2V93DRAFT_372528 [Kockiozyma suomiensis]|uniref:uncharacterized protein n=1 Tax=Kockiozyma suomiensis TaxID=1337062 RepID=UPI0033437B78
MNISKSVTRSLLTRQSLRCSHQSGRLLFTKTLLFSPSKVNTLEKYLAFRFTRSFSATVGVRSTSLDDDYKIDEISSSEFHTIADETLENILTHCEDLADTKPQIDIELAQGVLTLILPPNGTYVINKQPPNKQIWLSSPISGPKRYDLIDGQWTYHRDGSTLGNLLREEVTEALGIEATFDGVDDYSKSR